LRQSGFVHEFIIAPFGGSEGILKYFFTLG
jgi:hypothetical protein